MSKTYNLAIIGCGDFVRVQADALKASSRVKVAKYFDTDPARAARWIPSFGGQVANSIDEILNDSSIDIVGVWVPTFLHRDLIVRAAKAGKHILATKPLAPTYADCAASIDAIRAAKVRAGTIYIRTGNASIETIKRILDSGEHGKLGLYRRDWIHHYPQWNNWATDPAKNGGPFMDAMIHNLNMSRYLMGRPATACTFFSDNHSQKLACNDTESLKIDFADHGSAFLFITWSAELATWSKDGNFREGISIMYMVTDQGAHITETTIDGRAYIQVSQRGKKIMYPVVAPELTAFDGFAKALETGGPLPSDLAEITESGQDIYIIEQASKAIAQRIQLSLPWTK